MVPAPEDRGSLDWPQVSLRLRWAAFRSGCVPRGIPLRCQVLNSRVNIHVRTRGSNVFARCSAPVNEPRTVTSIATSRVAHV